MLKNFIKTTLRTLRKNKTYSFLNIFGLATGIACAGLIFLWVEDEMNYNSVNTKKDHIYAIGNNQNYDGKIFTFDGNLSFATPGLLAGALKAEVPGVVRSGRIGHGDRILFSLADKAVYESGYYVDPSIFNMFTIQFVQGSASSAFTQLNSVVVTEKMAKHFFGNDNNVIGKVLKANNKDNFTVSGVVKDLPVNSSVKFDWVAPFEIFAKQASWINSWQSNGVNTYVELSPSANTDKINKQIDGFVNTKLAKSNSRLFLFAMNDWRLRDKFVDGKQVGGRIEYVRMFIIIAWIILVIACINFMNLATARSEKRSKEVGVRKVMGAGKGVLIMQFIGEALCMSVLSVIAGIAIIYMVLPLFNTLVEKQLTMGLGNPLHLGVLAGIAIISGLIAGSYPALYLSSFNPIYVFKGIRLKNGGAAFIRKGLVVLQFSISIILIISTVIIYQQIQHIKSRDLGYNRNNLVTMDIRGDMLKNYNAIKHDMIASGAVENVGLNSMNVINTGDNGSVSNLQWDGKNPNLNVLVSFRLINPGFIATAGMQIVEGRDLLNEKTDTGNVLITQSFAKLMGKGSPIGKVITSGDNHSTVVGVVKDFVYGDMYGSPDPVIFICVPDQASYMYARLNPQVETSAALAKMEAVMKKDNAGYPFEYSFVDDQFNSRFKGETLIGKLSQIFAVLAIIISCLGLFGLAAYTAERRTKEIGIRKVLGASIAGLAGLLSIEFLQLVALSSIIAFPVAWWAMSNWLQSYTYRIGISWWVFAAAGLGAMFIALFTISFQAIKAALMNPVKSLRSE